MAELNTPQKLALAKGSGRGGFGYWLEQGIGKTWLLLEELRQLYKHHDVNFAVVVCPNTFKEGWMDEAKLRGYDEFNFVIYEASDHDKYVRAMLASYKLKPFLIMVVNYEAIRLEKTQLLIIKHAELSKNNAVIAADESIKFKNNDAIQTKSGIYISRFFNYKRTLTGKPSVQGPHDLWGQFKFMDVPELKGVNFYQFRNRFCIMGGYKMKQVMGIRPERIEELQAIINNNCFVARKDEYLDLPEKSWTERKVPLEPKLQKIYDEMQREMLVEFDSNIIMADMVLTRRIRQMQIASGFSISDEGKYIQLIEPEKNTRFKFVGEFYDEMNSKLIITTMFRSTMDSLLAMYSNLNPTFIRGGMQPEEIGENKRKFNNDKSSRVMFVQSAAAAYGHTLHADGDCHTMLFLEGDENLDVRSQIEDRIHRNGQINPCLYVDVYSNPLDKAIVKSLQRKESVAATILNYKMKMWDKNND